MDSPADLSQAERADGYPEPRARPRIDGFWLGVAAVGLVLLIASCLRFSSVVDDAYISFRYLDNWLAGKGLVFNEGERVEGYTNFLWIALLAPFRVIGLEPETAALIFSLVFLGLLLRAVFRSASTLAGDARAGWAALALAAASTHLARWTTAGMETVCFTALLAMAFERLAAAGRHTAGSSMLYGLAVLTRPVGLLHAAVAFGAALFGQERTTAGSLRRLLAPALVFAALPATHLAFRLAYYGEWLPNTFYAKLTGEMPDLVPGGLRYLERFLVSGGVTLVIAACLALLLRPRRRWMMYTLLAQAVLHTAYVVRVGGDTFPFGRFLVPIVPALAVLGGVGIIAVDSRTRSALRWLAPAVGLSLMLCGAWLANGSRERLSFEGTRQLRHERGLVAAWLVENLPPDTLLAVNAAGLIPYRTGMPALDMLGLNDRHIARAAWGEGGDGFAMVGHFKHDGRYVCDRAPDAVLTSGGTLRPARSAEEAVFQAALNTFPGDREFLRAPACTGRYVPRVEEISQDRYLVVYLRNEDSGVADPEAAGPPVTAEEWFERGLRLMRESRLGEAIEAFRESLEINPTSSAARLNLAYCYLDLGRPVEAVAEFERLLRDRPQEVDALYGLALAYEQLGRSTKAAALWRRYVDEAPESPWKEKAREHLELLRR